MRRGEVETNYGQMIQTLKERSRSMVQFPKGMLMTNT